MSLPQIQAPIYELKLPSNGKKIKFRSFLVKEEKLLMIANETGEEEERLTAVSQIINNCTFGKLNAREMAVFDVEYLFLQLRAKSVGETVEIKVLCPDDKKSYADVTVNIEDIKCSKPKKDANIIKLDENVGIILKYPTIDSSADTIIGALRDSIESIFDLETVFNTSDFSEEEITKFIESMTQKQLMKVVDFFENIPKVKLKVEVINPNTKVKSEVELEGLDSFF
jgi:hypothetical protein